MSALKPKVIPQPMVAEPEPEEPAVELAAETPELIKQEEARKRRRRRGRRKTIVTGELAPEVVGKRTLLG